MIQAKRFLALLLAATFVTVASCSSGGGTTAEGLFALIEFLEAGKDNLPRNRALVFRFSAEVAASQDFAERLKIENVQTGANSNFSRALGVYLVDGDRVTFVPQLPEKRDRSDAGFRANGNYIVFLKTGPDALASSEGDRLGAQQEFLFNTNAFFEDPIPTEPPRAVDFVARDTTTGATVNLKRLHPDPQTLATTDNADLIAAGHVIEPGAGGAPNYMTPWQFDLVLSEPIDPSTVSTGNITMTEIFSDATTSGEVAAPAAGPGYFGNAVSFPVPINVEAVQELASDGTVMVAIRVVPLFTLVDNTRYRITFSGNILGIDFRKAFIGENGLTGDGLDAEEPGGLGVVVEFIVRDRPAIVSTRTVTYDPLVDGILPESGQSSLDEAKFNSALYNPASSPSTAVGFLPDFGDGSDGDLAVSGGGTTILDTGDTPNEFIGNPFQVTDLNPNDLHNPTSISPGVLTYDSPSYFELSIASLTISSSATLRVIGVNPILFRVSGIVQITGTLDVSGEDGQSASGSLSSGGVAGAGGGDGGDSLRGVACNPGSSSCSTFAQIMSSGCSSIQAGGPFAQNGMGPGRGLAGGESFSYVYHELQTGLTGTGGGGGSHATAGTRGEDRGNANGAPGTPGPACASSSNNNSGFWAKNSSVIGVRGQPGPIYGDREVIAILWGGSGGAGGGSHHVYISFANGAMAGGAGGGGGGSLAIFAAGSISMPGGAIDASGGDGGKGSIGNAYSPQPAWKQASGSGGGGSGGTIVLISGDALNASGGLLDTRGGQGGVQPHIGTSTTTCTRCNAGGDGGKGIIFLMDADGIIDGIVPSSPGEYEISTGVLTISEFTTGRFSSISAVTELFNVLSANPEYLTMDDADILAVVASGQSIRVLLSSARGDLEEPLLPDPTTEIATVEMAVVSFAAGAVTVAITGDMSDLNPTGTPNRDAFVRVCAQFEYEDGVEAALGPFASIDVVVITFQFNGA